MSNHTGRIIHAASQPDLLRRYQSGQHLAYQRHQVDFVNQRPMSLAHLYLVVAQDNAGEFLGGCRVHLRRPGAGMPLESTTPRWPSLQQSLAPMLTDVCAELGGLWLSPSVCGSGLQRWLAQAGMATALWQGATWIMTFCHQHTAGLARMLGMSARSDVVPYPDERYHTALYAAHRGDLRLAAPQTRRAVNQLRTAITLGVSLPVQFTEARQAI